MKKQDWGPGSLPRAATLTRELQELDRLVGLVDRQSPSAWPKGLSWN